MNTAQMTPNELRQAGLDALVRELGPVGMIRFIQQFELGKGDYTKDRHTWLPDDIAAIMNEIRQQSPTE
jgi:hypothetical protein